MGALLTIASYNTQTSAPPNSKTAEPHNQNFLERTRDVKDLADRIRRKVNALLVLLADEHDEPIPATARSPPPQIPTVQAQGALVTFARHNVSSSHAAPEGDDRHIIPASAPKGDG
ncbi:hypothetical protein SUGI_0616620 [Cryptomeria japonica]|nr:hypothetical protein SUGI_0616620 [Cryptomeria japonica]